MSEQPEALRLAAELEKDRWHISGVTAQQSADELRRLHAEVERLREAANFAANAADGFRAEAEALKAEVERIIHADREARRKAAVAA